jgi:hypothetical protein
MRLVDDFLALLSAYQMIAYWHAIAVYVSQTFLGRVCYAHLYHIWYHLLWGGRCVSYVVLGSVQKQIYQNDAGFLFLVGLSHDLLFSQLRLTGTPPSKTQR